MRPCPPIQDALRRGNPPLSLHHTPPRPSEDPRKHAGTLSRRPRTATLHACAKLRPKRLFLLYRARRVLFLALTKREWWRICTAVSMADIPRRNRSLPF